MMKNSDGNKKRGMNHNKLFLTTLLMFITAFQISTAQSKYNDEWELSVIPYFWIADLKGETELGSHVLPFDIGFEDISDKIKGGGALNFEASRNEWGYGVHFFFLSLADENRSLEQIGIPTSVDYELMILMFEAYANYDLYKDRNGVLEGIFGLRYNSQELDVTVLNGTDSPAGNYSKTWIDPFFGIQSNYDFDNKIYLNIRGDVGGLGIGSLATVNFGMYAGYKISKVIDIGLGFKQQYTLYDDGEEGDADYYKYSAIQHGLTFGIGFTF